MKVGLVWRSLPTDNAAGNYLKKFAQAITDAGHTPVLITDRDDLSGGWTFGKVLTLAGANPVAFSIAVGTANPRRECDFIFSFEPGVACDCLE